MKEEAWKVELASISFPAMSLAPTIPINVSAVLVPKDAVDLTPNASFAYVFISTKISLPEEDSIIEKFVNTYSIPEKEFCPSM